MADYQEELHRRTGQFAGYLKKMHHRAHEEIHGSCFIIFSEKPPRGESGRAAAASTATPAIALVEATLNDGGIASISLSEEPTSNLPEDGWKQDDSQSRFVQFSFQRDWFCLDMPRQTLCRAEAERILRSRPGFFYLRDRPEFTLFGEPVDGYDPFRKIYIYGDEDSAAEDMAFVFFQVWRFPVDWRFLVRSAAFGRSRRRWEHGEPVE